MNRLVIIGNGFDLAHGLKTSYKDFIKDYINSVINFVINLYFKENESRLYEDNLLSIRLKDFCTKRNNFFNEQ